MIQYFMGIFCIFYVLLLLFLVLSWMVRVKAHWPQQAQKMAYWGTQLVGSGSLRPRLCFPIETKFRVDLVLQSASIHLMHITELKVLLEECLRGGKEVRWGIHCLSVHFLCSFIYYMQDKKKKGFHSKDIKREFMYVLTLQV